MKINRFFQPLFARYSIAHKSSNSLQLSRRIIANSQAFRIYELSSKTVFNSQNRSAIINKISNKTLRGKRNRSTYLSFLLNKLIALATITFSPSIIRKNSHVIPTMITYFHTNRRKERNMNGTRHTIQSTFIPVESTCVGQPYSIESRYHRLNMINSLSVYQKRNIEVDSPVNTSSQITGK